MERSLEQRGAQRGVECSMQWCNGVVIGHLKLLVRMAKLHPAENSGGSINLRNRCAPYRPDIPNSSTPRMIWFDDGCWC